MIAIHSVTDHLRLFIRMSSVQPISDLMRQAPGRICRNAENYKVG